MTRTSGPRTPGLRVNGGSTRWLKAAGIIWILAGLVYLTGEAIAASAFPGYSYATNYISDLGVAGIEAYQGRSIDSPLHGVMNTAFLLQGALFLAAALLVTRPWSAPSERRAAPLAFASLAAVHAVGITLVGLVHGSAENAANGLGAPHVLGAAFAILGGNVAAITAGIGSRRRGSPRWYAVASAVLGAVGILALAFLEIDSGSAAIDLLPDGVWERASVYSITTWELLTGIALVVTARRTAGPTAE